MTLFSEVAPVEKYSFRELVTGNGDAVLVECPTVLCFLVRLVIRFVEIQGRLLEFYAKAYGHLLLRLFGDELKSVTSGKGLSSPDAFHASN